MTRDATAVDLLLAAGGTVEKVHQAAWLVLLRDSEFGSELGLDLGKPLEVHWEPDGRTFDLKIAGPQGSAWIELKVDSNLGEGQLERQLKYTSKDHVVYALLGLAWARSRPWKVKRARERGARVFGPDEVISALNRAGRRSGVAPGVAELAKSYAGLVDGLRRRGEDFRSVDIKSWGLAHSVYFFEQLRGECPSMKDAAIEYVPNPSRAFEACHWGWVTVREGVRCYLQWEDRKLCVKVLVEAKSVRGAVRDAAVKAVVGREIGPWSIERPKPLGSGRTMTVGVLEGLPVRDGERWAEVVGVMGTLTGVLGELAEQLRSGQG